MCHDVEFIGIKVKDWSKQKKVVSPPEIMIFLLKELGTGEGTVMFELWKTNHPLVKEKG